MELGNLTKMDLREVWKHEAKDFTEWLAKDENIERINEVIGLVLTDVKTEVSIGNYRVDMTCEDATTGHKVIIENQLEKTDHDHLGKIITYASGIDARYIIWIAKYAREEHRSAVEWLNNITSSQVHFFLLEAELWKVDDSKPALRFNVLEQPNEWSKLIRSETDSEAKIKRKEKYSDFWTTFNEVLLKESQFKARKAPTDHWYDLPLGTSEAHLNTALINKQNSIRLAINIIDNKTLFDRLYERRDIFQSYIDFNLIWERMDDKKSSRIETYITDFSLEKSEQHEEIAKKCLDILVKLKYAFTVVYSEEYQ